MTLSLLAVLLFNLPFLGHGDNQDRRSHLGTWTLEVRQDRFAGRLRCHLGTGRVDYTRQTLVIHLSPHADTSDAIYRFDGGPPISVRSDEMELARLGFALHDDDLRNPSGGLVRIPAERIMAARVVAIEAQRFGPRTKIRIDGFADALAAARTAGCGTDDFN